MEKVQPHLTANNFPISFTTDVEPDRMTSILTLRHISGHSESNKFTVRVGQGPPKATPTQADGAAKTYAKRGALCDCLNIVIDHDDDARAVGSPIGKALAEDLKKRCIDADVDIAKFLKFAQAAEFEAIPDEMFDRLDAVLTKKEIEKGLKLADGRWK